jgi:hypothetical protein
VRHPAGAARAHPDYSETMKRTTKRWIWVPVAVLALWWVWPERGEAPDERLVGHLNATCSIAKDNVSSPERGVGELFSYLGEHSPQMMKEFGELLVLIERIDDDAAHDARAKKAAQRLRGALLRCEPHWERFLLAVEREPRARARFERGVERLGRTLEILFGGKGAAFAPLPRELLPGA